MPEKKEEIMKPTCFVIMPFSDPEGYETGHFRSIYEYTFAPAIRMAGYEPLRIDDNIVSSLIHGKMMNELVSAPMVLCDLSTNNPNVLYELGIRHAFDLPVVLVQEYGQKRIFDIAGITSVEYHRSRLYEETLEDQRRIEEAIRQTANAKTKYSIMGLVALQSAKPVDRGEITSEQQTAYLLQQLSQKLDGFEKQFSRLASKVSDNQRYEQSIAVRDMEASKEIEERQARLQMLSIEVQRMEEERVYIQSKIEAEHERLMTLRKSVAVLNAERLQLEQGKQMAEM